MPCRSGRTRRTLEARVLERAPDLAAPCPGRSRRSGRPPGPGARPRRPRGGGRSTRGRPAATSAMRGSWSRTSGARASSSSASTYGGLLTTGRTRARPRGARAGRPRGSARGPPGRGARAFVARDRERLRRQVDRVHDRVRAARPRARARCSRCPCRRRRCAGAATSRSRLERRPRPGARSPAGGSSTSGVDTEVVPPESLLAGQVLERARARARASTRRSKRRAVGVGERPRRRARSGPPRPSRAGGGAGARRRAAASATPDAASRERRPFERVRGPHGGSGRRLELLGLVVGAQRLHDSRSGRRPGRPAAGARVRPMRWSVTRDCWKL